MILGKYFSPMGPLTIAVEGDFIVGLWFDDQKYFGSKIKAGACFGEHPLLNKAYEWLEVYFSGLRPEFMLPLYPVETDNLLRVRNAMLAIPYGEVVSYSELAEKAGMPRAVRAVAGMVSRNPIILVVPCHRIIGKNGSLTGYAAGLDRKKILLELEGQSS